MLYVYETTHFFSAFINSLTSKPGVYVHDRALFLDLHQEAGNQTHLVEAVAVDRNLQGVQLVAVEGVADSGEAHRRPEEVANLAEAENLVEAAEVVVEGPDVTSLRLSKVGSKKLFPNLQ